VDTLARLIERHGWHVIGELTALVVVTVFTVSYVIALIRGRVQALVCPTCGRVVSRADLRCPRCRKPLRPA
jgi:predicted amidophosphoribosyltransferase